MLTAALLLGQQAFIANIGDSRTYLLRKNTLYLLTRDYSLMMRMVESKQIEQDAIYFHPQRNLVYRCLGAAETVEVDLFHETLQAGDKLLLCSAG